MPTAATKPEKQSRSFLFRRRFRSASFPVRPPPPALGRTPPAAGARLPGISKSACGCRGWRRTRPLDAACLKGRMKRGGEDSTGAVTADATRTCRYATWTRDTPLALPRQRHGSVGARKGLRASAWRVPGVSECVGWVARARRCGRRGRHRFSLSSARLGARCDAQREGAPDERKGSKRCARAEACTAVASVEPSRPRWEREKEHSRRRAHAPERRRGEGAMWAGGYRVARCTTRSARARGDVRMRGQWQRGIGRA